MLLCSINPKLCFILFLPNEVLGCGYMILCDASKLLCDASKWRLGTAAVVPGLPPLRLMPQSRRATPSVYSVVLGRPYVTRVVDRTVGACPITCSPRHLPSHLFHSYISTTHSLRPRACISSFCVILGRYRLRAWGSEDNETVID